MNLTKIGLTLPGINVLSVDMDLFRNLLIKVETTEEYTHCRICKKKLCKRHGSDRERKVQHLPVFGNKTYIIYSPNRYICEDCDDRPTTTATPSWHSSNGSHTTDYENKLLMELVNSTVVDVAIKSGETEESLMGVIHRRVAGKINWDSIDYLGVIGIDEIALKKGYRDYVTIITSRHQDQIKILAVLEGRKKATIIGFLKNIPKNLVRTIEAICVDLYEGYINAIKAVFKNKIPIVADRFHVAQLYRKELDQFRQKVLGELKQELSKSEYKEITGATRILRRTNECLTDEEKKITERLFSYSPELMEAYSLGLKLTHIFNTHCSKSVALEKFDKWIKLVRKSKLRCFDKFIKTFRKWKNEITNYFIDRNTSAFVEGFNNKIKVLKRRCYGIFNLKHFFQRLFLDLSGYELYATNKGV